MFLNGLGGTASLGGALNYISKTAPAAPIRNLALTYRSQSQFGVEADLGDRFGEGNQFGYRINLGFRDGNTAVDEQTWQQGNASVVLDWRANPGLRLGRAVLRGQRLQEHPAVLRRRQRRQRRGHCADSRCAPNTRKKPRTHLRPSIRTQRSGGCVATGTLPRLDGDIAGRVRRWPQRPALTRPGQQDTRFGCHQQQQPATSRSSRAKRARVRTCRPAGCWCAVTSSPGPCAMPSRWAPPASRRRTIRASRSLASCRGISIPTMTSRSRPPCRSDLYPYTGKTTSSGLLVSDIMSFDDHWSVLLGGARPRSRPTTPMTNKIPGGEISKFTPVAALMYKPSRGLADLCELRAGARTGRHGANIATNPGQIVARS